MYTNTFKIVYADPPWNWKARSPKGDGRSAKRHYQVMDLQAIKNLPVSNLGDKDSILLMWVTDPFLEFSFEVATAWGYRFSTVGFYWIKTLRKSHGYHIGNGYYTRANPEQCLLFRRGKAVPRVDKSVRKLIVAPIGPHSAKPHETYERIEALFGNTSRVELFARNYRLGWDVWGNQINSTISFAGLEAFSGI